MASIFKISKIFMIITGIWALPLTTYKAIDKLYSVYSNLIHSIYALFSVSLMIRFIELVQEGAKSDTLFGSLTLAIILTTMIYKIFIYLKNGIPLLFTKVIMEEDKWLRSEDEEIRHCYMDQTKFFKWTISTQIMCTFFTVVMFIASNFYKKITNTFRPGEVFMYEIWAPFDKIKFDTAITVFNVCMVTIGFFNYVAVAAAPQTLMVFVTAQLKILQIRLRKSFDDGVDLVTAQIRIKQLIKEHQLIIEFCGKLNAGIKNVILIEYILDSVNVAAALLHIITVEFSGEMIFSIFHFSLLLVQIFILAWTADEINTQSINVGYAVYESDWINQDQTIKKMVQIIMMRAQKPLAIDIGPFRPMNLNAALITLKGAYSYTSLMMQKYT